MRLGTFFMPASQLGAHTSHFSSPLFCFFPSTAGGICHRAAPRVHQQTTGRPHCSPQSEITHITLAPAAQSAKFPPKEHPRAPGSKLVHVRERRTLRVRWRDLGPAQSGTTGTETHPSEAGPCGGNGHAALGYGGMPGRAVAEQLVGGRFCEMAGAACCRSRPRKTTPLH